MEKEKILEILKKRHEETGGHNGYTVVQLHQISGITIIRIAGYLNKLYKEEKIKISDSVHGKIARIIA